MQRLLLLGLVVLWIAGCSFGSSAEAFDFAEDDLCEWVSEADVASFVTEAYERSGVEWDRTVAAVPADGSAWDLSGDYCRWEPTGGGYVIARALASTSLGGGVLPYDDVGDYRSLDHTVSGHPDFDDNIIVGNAAFGRYWFQVEGSDDALGLEMSLTDGISQNDWDQQEQMLFSVANSFLDKMGWTS